MIAMVARRGKEGGQPATAGEASQATAG